MSPRLARSIRAPGQSEAVLSQEWGSTVSKADTHCMETLYGAAKISQISVPAVFGSLSRCLLCWLVIPVFCKDTE